MSAVTSKDGYTFSTSDIYNAVQAGGAYIDMLNRISALENKVNSIPFV